MADNRRLANKLSVFTPVARENMARRSDDMKQILFFQNNSNRNPLKSPPTASLGLLPKGGNASRVDANVAYENGVSNQNNRGGK